MKWYLYTLKQYTVFQGRACRKEFCFFVLFQALAYLIISFIERQAAIANPEILFGWVTVIFCLLTFLPGLAVSSRRLHDIGLSGWWVLLYLVPVLGLVLVLILLIIKGVSGKNKYGDEPSCTEVTLKKK